jgi:peptidoglycan/xylan/chitin deacetylase (PgdA/CDA1 family)
MLRISDLGKYLRFVVRTKGLTGLILRIGMLFKRFDIFGIKMKNAVLEIENIGKKYKYRPTIIIPAVVLKRHRNLLSHLSDANVEFAIHGYTHKDFKPLGLHAQLSEIRKAKDAFNELEIHAYGFRAPYLSWNDYTTEAVEKSGLLWESNETLIWNGFRNLIAAKSRHFMENAIHQLYKPLDAEKNAAIPRLEGKIIRIPVALPDDEMLVDRLGIKDSERISQLWIDIMEDMYERGGVFVLQLHPERFRICQNAMESLLQRATVHSKPSIWITGMREIAEWWKEKSRFRFTLEAMPDKGYRIRCECTDRATILCRNHSTEASKPAFYQDYSVIEDREFFIESKDLKPCIGIHPQCSKTIRAFLTDEGFCHEVSDKDSKYSVFFDECETFVRKDEMHLLRRIAESPNPILRYWRWPAGMRSAFVTTHDLDSVTITDFLLRLLGR